MRGALLLAIAGCTFAQNLADALKRGEEVFNKTCGTAYCHGARGVGGGAPRLAARGFEQGYINGLVRGGVPGTQMAAFSATLSAAELSAVVAYVATLNGIANPAVGPGGPPAGGRAGAPALSAEATRGRALFSEATRSFGRCSTCHEINGIGISVTTPIAKVPADVAALKALATPNVATAAAGGESMPALVVAKRAKSVSFYDLTSPPPVLRTAEPTEVRISEGSAWKHSSVLGTYTDAELSAILSYLRSALEPRQ